MFKVAWLKWDVVCKRKEFGGMGIKNLELFNSALLGKWAWRLVVGGESLWVQVV